MAMLRTCAADGCNTKTLGVHCIQHESAPRLAVVGYRSPKVTVEKVAELVQLR